MASEDDVVIKFEGQDASATEVARKVREELEKEFEAIGFAGDKAADGFEHIGSELENINWASLEDGSRQLTSLQAAVASAAGEFGVLSGDIGHLVEMLGSIPSAPVAAIGVIAAGAAVSGKMALESYTATLDKNFKGNGQDIYSSTAQAAESQMFLDRQRQERDQKINEERKRKLLAEQDATFRLESTRGSINSFLGEQREGIGAMDSPLVKAAIDARKKIKQEMEKNNAWIPQKEQDQMVAAAVEIAKAEEAKRAELERQKELKEEMADLDKQSADRISGWIEKGMSDKELRRKDELQLFGDMMAGKMTQAMYDRAMAGIAVQYAGKEDKKVKLDLGGGENSYESRFATRAPGTVSQLDVLKKLLQELKDGNHKQRLEAKTLTDWLERNGIVLGSLAI